MSDNDKLDTEHTLATGSSAARTARQLKPGDLVGGNYKIKWVVGRGGMGVVYCAEHLVVDRDVALKALVPELVDEANWQRFQTEGKAVAKLDHPNIVKVYDMGTDGPDCLYYVMDLLHGVSLADYIRKKGILELSETLEIFQQLCSGLGYAHRQGLVHRDIKPTNIILCHVVGQPALLVKIIDFGLVKLVGEADQLKQSQTATGLVCGSPLYMSPEQCMGSKIDARSDIYSLGCTLFECLVGKPPFRGITGLETAAMQENDRPPKLNDLCPDKDYDDNVEQLVGRMLEKIPAQRYQSMSQVAQDLQRVQGGKSISRAPVFKDVPLFEIDESAQEELAAPDRTAGVPLAWILAVSAVGFLFVIGATVSFFFDQKATRQVSGVSNVDSKHAREVFARWPQISNGVVDKNGEMVRIFKFPEVSLGYISWGPGKLQPRYKKPATGEVIVPADQPVTLQLTRREGAFARAFPSILTKIGPEDVYSLEVNEPNVATDDDFVAAPINVEFVQSISKWTALRQLDLNYCSLSRQTVLALNDIVPLGKLSVRNSPADGNDLAKVKWLDRLTELDVRSIHNVDPVLNRLAGSYQLGMLTITRTGPSIEALQGLAKCQNLQALNLDDCLIDDAKLAVVCSIPNLKYLALRDDLVSAKALMQQLPRLKKLIQLDIVYEPINQEDYLRLVRSFPKCEIEWEKWDKLDKNYSGEWSNKRLYGEQEKH